VAALEDLDQLDTNPANDEDNASISINNAQNRSEDLPIASSNPLLLSTVNLAPNPATENVTVHIQSPKTSIEFLQVFNSQGSKIFEKEVGLVQGFNSIRLNILEWPTGIYYVFLSNGLWRIIEIIRPTYI